MEELQSSFPVRWSDVAADRLKQTRNTYDFLHRAGVAHLALDIGLVAERMKSLVFFLFTLDKEATTDVRQPVSTSQTQSWITKITKTSLLDGHSVSTAYSSTTVNIWTLHIRPSVVAAASCRTQGGGSPLGVRFTSFLLARHLFPHRKNDSEQGIHGRGYAQGCPTQELQPHHLLRSSWWLGSEHD